MFRVPLHQVKHTDSLGCDGDEALKYLSLTPNLETCELSPMVPESEHPHVLLRHLRYLHIIIRGDLGILFDKLILPMLHDLSILLWNVPWTAIPQLISLISRGSLEKLKFYSNPTNRHPLDNDMIRLLLAAHTLVELDLTGSTPQCLTEPFLARFAYHQHLENMNVPQLLPALHIIKVDYTPKFFDVLAFADAVQSRMEVSGIGRASLGVCLRMVEIRCFPAYNSMETLSSVALSRFQQLQDLGLEVSITYGQNVFGEFT
jgi:hypothetical protein